MPGIVDLAPEFLDDLATAALHEARDLIIPEQLDKPIDVMQASCQAVIDADRGHTEFRVVKSARSYRRCLESFDDAALQFAWAGTQVRSQCIAGSVILRVLLLLTLSSYLEP